MSSRSARRRALRRRFALVKIPMMGTPRVPQRDLGAAFLVAVAAVALRGPLLRSGLNLADEGYHVYGVERLAQGQLLYRDFERIYPPGVYYAFLPVARVWGADPVAFRRVWLLALAVL